MPIDQYEFPVGSAGGIPHELVHGLIEFFVVLVDITLIGVETAHIWEIRHELPEFSHIISEL